MPFDSKAALQLLRFDEGFDGSIRFEEPMARHTTYRIGGPALCWAQVDSITSLGYVLDICARSGMPWVTVGKGSNLLVSDEGYDGVVLSLGRDFKKWDYDPEAMKFTVGAAASLSRIVQEAFHQGVSGLEFAVGTPGTMGGALRMNAGSRTEWLGSRVVSVTAYRAGGGLKRYLGTDIEWGYRHSSLPADEVIAECVLSVKPGEVSFIRAKMEGSLARRKRSQPLEFPSCGSVFRNPDGKSAGALIEGAGLKGKIAGGARISDKHANFIVNIDGAKAADVVALIKAAQCEVKREYGIELQPEVRFLGFAE